MPILQIRFADEAPEPEAPKSKGKGQVSGKFIEFLEEMDKQNKKVRNPDTGNQVKVKSLKGPKGKQLVHQMFEAWLKKDKPESESHPASSKEKTPKSEHVDKPQDRYEEIRKRGQTSGKEHASLILKAHQVDNVALAENPKAVIVTSKAMEDVLYACALFTNGNVSSVRDPAKFDVAKAKTVKGCSY